MRRSTIATLRSGVGGGCGGARVLGGRRGARAPEPAAVAAARAYLGHHLRCGLSDGRVVVGKFACFDKQQNILLNEAREWRWDAAQVRSERTVGTVIVPRQHLMSCHVLVEHKEAPEAAG